MQAGLIQWFDAEKGFGVIATVEGEEAFLHINGFVQSRPTRIEAGLAVMYKPKPYPAKDRFNARHYRLIDQATDWPIAMACLGHSERAKYFCYRCGAAMQESASETFQCSSCKGTYETAKYKLDRSHRNLEEP